MDEKFKTQEVDEYYERAQKELEKLNSQDNIRVEEQKQRDME
jgi:hypothetical protein